MCVSMFRAASHSIVSAGRRWHSFPPPRHLSPPSPDNFQIGRIDASSYFVIFFVWLMETLTRWECLDPFPLQLKRLPNVDGGRQSSPLPLRPVLSFQPSSLVCDMTNKVPLLPYPDFSFVQRRCMSLDAAERGILGMVGCIFLYNGVEETGGVVVSW